MSFNLRNVVFGIAVFVLAMFVTTYGVNTFYSQPQYEDFCSSDVWSVSEMNESDCLLNGGKWTAYQTFKACEEGEVCGYCDREYNCREDYDISREEYSMNVFLIAIPLGILLLLGGFYFFRLEPIGIGVMLAGVGTMLRGIGSYWRYSADWVRFLVSLIGLLIVVGFYYWFEKRVNTRKKGSAKRKTKKK